ncbi:hypothetical protein [Pleurocapsa sp. PCC 7319]|uniref:hypothetical protein n=1 Tax=Pleurocapsa sp. PCC 7319 TaxID=118161 RepID=UPI0003448F46|nr:hypothetical protein [Pleurocapsa sp. PCC 7319]
MDEFSAQSESAVDEMDSESIDSITEVGALFDSVDESELPEFGFDETPLAEEESLELMGEFSDESESAVDEADSKSDLEGFSFQDTSVEGELESIEKKLDMINEISDESLEELKDLLDSVQDHEIEENHELGEIHHENQINS